MTTEISIFGLEDIATTLERIKEESAGKTPVPTIAYDHERPTYESAAAFNDLRQKYLDTIALGPLRSRITGVEYRARNDTSNIFTGRNLMSTTADNNDARLLVYDRAFMLEYEDDFRSCLIDHELVHVAQVLNPHTRKYIPLKIQFGKKITLFTMIQDTASLKASQCAYELITAALEIPAYTNQLTNGAYTNHISEELASKLRKNLLNYRRFIDAVRKTTGVHPRDMLRDPDDMYERLRQNVDAIDDVLRGPQT